MGLIVFHANGDGCWPDLLGKIGTPAVHHATTEANRVELGFLAAGTVSGKPSVSLRIDLDDGTVVLAEFTANEFMAAAACVKGAVERGS